MKRFILVFLAVLAVIGAGRAHASLVSTFDTSAEGWDVWNGATFQYNSSGGTPGGFIQGTDTTVGHYWYFTAPATWFDTAEKRNWSGYINGTLEFDLKIIAPVGDLDRRTESPDVVILSGSKSYVWPARNSSPHILPDNTWKTFSVELNETLFSQDGGSPITFAALMSNVTGLRIRGEHSGSHSDIEGLDNFRVNAVPIPGAVWLLGSGLAGLLGLRRKFF